MKSNLNVSNLDEIMVLAKEIHDWICSHDNPERYNASHDLKMTRDFVHTMDLLETVFIRFAINAHFSRIALAEI